MLFLIDYDRREGKIVEILRFSDADRHRAEETRLQLELRLNRSGIDREVVLLDATDEQALRQTHGRYFRSITELIT
jgi:hypothetical protein